MLDAINAIKRENLLKEKKGKGSARLAAKHRKQCAANPKLKAQAIKLRKNHTAKEVAKLLGISESTVYVYCKGTIPKPKPLRTDPEVIAKVVELVKIHKQEEVGKILGISQTTVWQILQNKKSK